MHFLGYLVTLANLHTLSGGSPNNMSIRVGTLQSIAEEVRNLPVPLDGFRKNGYQRFDSIGIYLSKNVQDYLFYNQGQPDDEGLMLTLYFNGDKEAENTGRLDGRHNLFVHREPVSVEIQRVIDNYAKTGRWPENSTENKDNIKEEYY